MEPPRGTDLGVAPEGQYQIRVEGNCKLENASCELQVEKCELQVSHKLLNSSQNICKTVYHVSCFSLKPKTLSILE